MKRSISSWPTQPSVREARSTSEDHAVTVKFLVTPGGEKLAILPAEEFEDMRDTLAHQKAMADYRAGRIYALTLDETRALLAAPTRLAFWRAKRGLTQAKLAKAAGTTQPHIADLESGKHAARSKSWRASRKPCGSRSTTSRPRNDRSAPIGRGRPVHSRKSSARISSIVHGQASGKRRRPVSSRAFVRALA
jgi:DNA-binding XRE family transcriptional regulator